MYVQYLANLAVTGEISGNVVKRAGLAIDAGIDCCKEFQQDTGDQTNRSHQFSRVLFSCFHQRGCIVLSSLYTYCSYFGVMYIGWKASQPANIALFTTLRYDRVALRKCVFEK